MTVPLWSRDELTAVLELVEAATVDVDGISIDSRTLRPGDLFVALSGRADARYRGAGGSGRDGHDFVSDAAQRGAAAALVSRRTGIAIPELLVEDTFDGLWRLARAARARFHRPVFAITGSSGKTTAKAMLAAALPACHASEGSFNNHIGVPLSLARLRATAAAGVFEVGMNSPGEIAPLSRLIRPDVALLLNVLGVHLEGLGSLEAIRREKLSIAEGLGDEGILVVPDTLDIHDLPDDLKRITFGRSSAADVRLDDSGQVARIHLQRAGTLELALAVDGPHRRLTATGVLACLEAAGLDPTCALEPWRTLEPPAGRGGELQVGGITVVDDSYNANPESIRLAIASLRERTGRRRYALLGDMLELGPEEASLHAGLAEACVGLDGVFCVGERMRALHERLPTGLRAGWWPDCAMLDLDAVIGRLHPGDLLLVKASNRLFWKAGTVNRIAVALATRVG